MVFGGLFKKNEQKAVQKKPEEVPQNKAEPAHKKEADDVDFDEQELDPSFAEHIANPQKFSDLEKDMESPEKLLAEEVLDEKIVPMPIPKSQFQAPKQAAFQKPQGGQKIPAFVSLDRYKEIRLALRDMKMASLEMRKTLQNLAQNRDGGTALLNTTVDGLQRIEGNIDKIRGVLRT
ncbi:Uncharacterised protein [uncultured archaeon]|nr:Uncharacterised protein [uncultured archaeon]